MKLHIGTNILVTGGAGFIGSHMVDALLERGNSVTVLDDFSTGKMENLPVSNPKVKIIRGSIVDTAIVDEAMQGCDAIIHLAAIASVQKSVEQPYATHQVNFDGTVNLLESAKKHGVTRIIYASSAAVYGDTEIGPVSESDRLCPLTPYAIDKLFGEYYLSHYYRTCGINFTACRFFNVFGPRQDPLSPYSGVISIFMQNFLEDKPIKVFDDGLQTRDFIYVKDVVNALIGFLNVSESFGRSVNIGTGVSITLLDLIDAIQKVFDKDGEILHFPRQPGHIRHSAADVSVLKSLLGKTSNTSLYAGLKSIL